MHKNAYGKNQHHFREKTTTIPHKGLLSPEIAKMPSDGRVYLAVGMAMWHGAAAFIFMLGRVVRVSNLYRLS